MFPLRHIVKQPAPGYRAVIFRRTFNLIMQPGGIWDESFQIYPYVGGVSTQTPYPTWRWDDLDIEVVFAHMQYHPKDTYAKKGMQAELIAFEELTEFEEEQFFYMVSRNRSRCGVKPQMIATTNPEYDSWVRLLLSPWIDPTYPDRAESGEIRYFIRGDDNVIRWLKKGETHPEALSLTFIAASLDDNPALKAKDPDYERRLNALPLVERLKLKYGDWFARKVAGKVFKRIWFKIIDVPPADIVKWVRFWDFAATEDERKEQKNAERGGPDYTACVLIGKTARNSFVVLHAMWDRLSPLQADEAAKNLAAQDGRRVAQRMEQEPGGSGKRDVAHFRRTVFFGYDFRGIPSMGDKLERSRIPSSHVEQGNVELLRGDWNEGFLNFMEAFPSPKVHDDVPDAFDGSILCLINDKPSAEERVDWSKRYAQMLGAGVEDRCPHCQQPLEVGKPHVCQARGNEEN
jgi:predicted phage terminase large subunit-like protein